MIYHDFTIIYNVRKRGLTGPPWTVRFHLTSHFIREVLGLRCVFCFFFHLHSIFNSSRCGRSRLAFHPTWRLLSLALVSLCLSHRRSVSPCCLRRGLPPYAFSLRNPPTAYPWFPSLSRCRPRDCGSPEDSDASTIFLPLPARDLGCARAFSWPFFCYVSSLSSPS